MHTLRCDEIQHGRAVLMIYSLTADDIPLLSQWIKKRQAEACRFLVGVTGFEPTTSSSRTKRATKLRYTPMYYNMYYNTKEKRLRLTRSRSGCGTRIRTQTNRVRVCCATLTQFRIDNIAYYTLLKEIVKCFLKFFQNFLTLFGGECHGLRNPAYRRFPLHGLQIAENKRFQAL